MGMRYLDAGMLKAPQALIKVELMLTNSMLLFLKTENITKSNPIHQV